MDFLWCAQSQLNQERVQVDVWDGVGIADLYGHRQNCTAADRIGTGSECDSHHLSHVTYTKSHAAMAVNSGEYFST